MYKGYVRPLLEYAPLVWMGSSMTSLAQIDRVQRRALHIISELTWLPSLSLSLCYHIPVQAPLPRPVLTAPLLYSAASGPDSQYPLHAVPQLHCPAPPTSLSSDIPLTARASLHRAFPIGIVHTWNSLPPPLLDHPPSLAHMQAFKVGVFRFLGRHNWLWANDSL